MEWLKIAYLCRRGQPIAHIKAGEVILQKGKFLLGVLYGIAYI